MFELQVKSLEMVPVMTSKMAEKIQTIKMQQAQQCTLLTGGHLKSKLAY